MGMLITVFNVILLHTLIPLQITNLSDLKWRKGGGGDPTTQAIWFVVGIVAVIIILVIVNLIKRKTNIPALNGVPSPTSVAPRQFSAFALHRMAIGMGLDRAQVKMLEFVMKCDGVTDPAHSLNTPAMLDRHFKRAYHIILQTAVTEEEAQQKLLVLFATRNLIETNSGGVNATSTRQIPENVQAMLAANGENYLVKVISSKGEALIVENPVTSNGEPVRIPRGSKVSIAFATKSSKSFSFDTRVTGSKEGKDSASLYLVHSGQIKRLSNRRFRRRQTAIDAAFYLVNIETVRRKETQMVVDKRKLSGSILDISIGGCSVKTKTPLSSGQRLKIEFSSGGTQAAALGQVLRTNQSGVSAIMHVKFLKIPRRSLNSINAMVYEYT